MLLTRLKYAERNRHRKNIYYYFQVNSLTENSILQSPPSNYLKGPFLNEMAALVEQQTVLAYTAFSKVSQFPKRKRKKEDDTFAFMQYWLQELLKNNVLFFQIVTLGLVQKNVFSYKESVTYEIIVNLPNIFFYYQPLCLLPIRSNLFE